MPHPQRGVALVLVLWLVAGLALLAGALASTARTGVRSADTSRVLAAAEALGDGAITLAMLDFLSDRGEPSRGVRRLVRIDGRQVEVVLTPLNGFVNINRAGEPLLAALFETAGQLSPNAARQLAQRVLDWRDTDTFVRPDGAEDAAYEASGFSYRTRGGRFESVDDLMQVLGMSYEVFARVERLIVTDGRSGGVNPRSAPAEVLLVLTGGNRAAVNAILADREGQNAVSDTSAINPEFLDNASVPAIRAEARIDVGQGRRIVRAHEVWMRLSGRGLPWESVRVEAARYARND